MSTVLTKAERQREAVHNLVDDAAPGRGRAVDNRTSIPRTIGSTWKPVASWGRPANNF